MSTKTIKVWYHLQVCSPESVKKARSFLQQAMVNGCEDAFPEEALVNVNDAAIPGGENDPNHKRPGYMLNQTPSERTADVIEIAALHRCANY